MEIVNNTKLRPNAGDAYGAGWNIMWKSFMGLLAVTLIYGLISGFSAIFQGNENDFEWYMVPMFFLALILGVFVIAPIRYSVKWVFLKAVREESFEIRDMFAVFQKNYWNAVGANVVVGIILAIGYIMLIIPGIILTCRLAFVPYLVIDREMEMTDAMNSSWELTKGYGWQIFFMGILAFFIAILGLIALVFGVIISAVWIDTAFAVMYQAVVEEKKYFIKEV